MIQRVETRDDFLSLIGRQKIVAEIGVFQGQFSKSLLSYLDPERLHLIDTFEGMMCSGDKDGQNIVWDDLGKIYQDLVAIYKLDDRVTLHKGRSSDILSSFEDEHFDLIYIDGDHSYRGVKIDLEVGFTKTKLNGLICGHDYTTSMFPDVVRAVDEFCQNYSLEISYLTNDACPTYCIKKSHS
jgi:hypothetical protein